MFASALCLLAMIHNQQPASVVPTHRLSTDWWKTRHEACVEITKKGNVDLVFLGDSITQGWESVGKIHWDKHFVPLNAANFGFSGDQTQHVLWRMENGEIMSLDPKLIVIMIGTNNIGNGSGSTEDTALGVRTIVDKLRKGLPQSKILLLGIFPRGENSDDIGRQKVASATEQFKDLHDGKMIFFKDIGYAFTRRTGTLRTKLMPDKLHLTTDGYGIWAQAIVDDVHKLMGMDE